MSNILTVFGATGNQGGSVIKTILADPVLSKKWKIRGVTRDTSKPAAKELAASNVEMVSADMTTVESALPAVQGAHTVFLVTNFWETMSRDVEVGQGKAVTDACKQAGVQHLIYSSILNITELSKGKLTGLSHFDGKADIEAYVRASGLSCTFVLVGFFMSNFFQFFSKQGDKYVLAVPMDPVKAQYPLIDTAEDVGKFVKAAITHHPSTEGRRILAAQDYYTAPQIMQEFTEVTGQKAEVVRVPEDTFKSFIPAPAAEEMLQNMQLLEDPGYYGGESLEPSLALLDEKPTTWKEFVAKNRGKW